MYMQNLRLRCKVADDVAVVDGDDAANGAGGSPWGRQRRFQNNIL